MAVCGSALRPTQPSVCPASGSHCHTSTRSSAWKTSSLSWAPTLTQWYVALNSDVGCVQPSANWHVHYIYLDLKDQIGCDAFLCLCALDTKASSFQPANTPSLKLKFSFLVRKLFLLLYSTVLVPGGGAVCVGAGHQRAGAAQHPGPSAGRPAHAQQPAGALRHGPAGHRSPHHHPQERYVPQQVETYKLFHCLLFVCWRYKNINKYEKRKFKIEFNFVKVTQNKKLRNFRLQ